MKVTIRYALLIISCLFSRNLFSAELSGTKGAVKVLIHSQLPELLLEIKGGYSIYNPLDNSRIAWSFFSTREKVTVDPHGIRWGDISSGFYQLRFVPSNSEGSVLINGIQYKGSVEIYQREGKFSVVNQISIEDYLKAALAAEFPNPLHPEVMDALAILFRTQAYYLATNHKETFWHYTLDQNRYYSVASIIPPHIKKAVEMTEGAILNYKGAPFFALWTENSAGHTVDFSSFFRKEKRTPPPVFAPIAARDRLQHSWSHSIANQILAELLGLQQVKGIDLYMVNSSSKVYGLKIHGENRVREIDFLSFQKMVGKEQLPSNDFTVRSEGEQLFFDGFGAGHGVGLCLYSAQLMAEKGDGASKILTTFFPDTEITRAKR